MLNTQTRSLRETQAAWRTGQLMDRTLFVGRLSINPRMVGGGRKRLGGRLTGRRKVLMFLWELNRVIPYLSLFPPRMCCVDAEGSARFGWLDHSKQARDFLFFFVLLYIQSFQTSHTARTLPEFFDRFFLATKKPIVDKQSASIFPLWRVRLPSKMTNDEWLTPSILLMEDCRSKVAPHHDGARSINFPLSPSHPLVIDRLAEKNERYTFVSFSSAKVSTDLVEMKSKINNGKGNKQQDGSCSLC